MVSIDDVAHRAGVSTATVSRALSGRGQVSAAARSRVASAAAELGYVVSATASSLASGRARNIGVLLPHLGRWFFSTVLSGVSSALLDRGYDTTLYSLTDDPSARRLVFDDFLHRRRVDGVIAVSIELADGELAELAELDLPVIAIGPPAGALTTLTVDEIGMARMATDHLVGLGHREIALIGLEPDPALVYDVPTLRSEGYAQSLRTVGVAPHPALLEVGDFTLEGGFRAAQRLLGPARDARRASSHPLPTAIFAESDETALGALLAARELGLRVPGDLSIMGIDGHELGDFFRLTTVDQAPRSQGAKAAELILTRIARGSTAHAQDAPTELGYSLVVRDTTGPPAG